jgi:hypothetical protein
MLVGASADAYSLGEYEYVTQHEIYVPYAWCWSFPWAYNTQAV